MYPHDSKIKLCKSFGAFLLSSPLAKILCAKPIPPLARNSRYLVERVHTDVASLNGRLWGTETQANVLIPSSATLSDLVALRLGLRVEEDVRLLLERTFRLDGQLGGHGCKVSVDNDSKAVELVFPKGVGTLQEIGGRRRRVSSIRRFVWVEVAEFNVGN